MEWFFLYNGEGSSLLSNSSIGINHYPVCENINGRKRFGVFRSSNDLYMHLIECMSSSRCFYEMIRGNIRQKFYLDIDISLSKQISFFTREDKIAIGNKIPKISRDIITQLDSRIKSTDIMIFSSNSQDKISYHIVVDRYCFSNCEQNKNFFQKFIERVPENIRCFFDSTMYKPVQQFRLYMCTKSGTDRFKILDSTHSKWLINDEVSDDDLNYEIFKSSLITYTDNCLLLEDEEIYEDPKYYEEFAFNNKDISNMIKLIKKMPDFKYFDIGELSPPLISLRRLCSSRCKMCSEKEGIERIHDNENPFVYLTSSGNVYFDCRRGGGGMFIGNIKENKKTCQTILQEENIERTEKSKSKSPQPIIIPSPTSVVNSFSPPSETERLRIVKKEKIEKRRIEREQNDKKMTIAQRLLLI